MSTSREVRRLSHVRALDGLRGVAIALVVLCHTQSFLLPGVGVVDPDRGPLHGAFLGVDLFFVLSGFLITALLLGEMATHRRPSFGRFYARRATRLLPALYLLLAAHFAYAALTGLSMHTEWLGLRGAILYISNWTWKWDGLEAALGFGHLWSLAIEEQFYLVWPALLVLAFGVRRHIAWVGGCLVLAVAAVAINRAILWNQGQSFYFLYMRTDTRIDSLLVGALLAQLWVRGMVPRRGLGTAASLGGVGFLVLVVVTGWSDSFLYLGGYTLVAICAGLAVLAVTEGRWGAIRVLEWKPLCVLGVVSYGLYLWHLPVFDAVSRYGAKWSAPVRILVAYVLAGLLTAASWLLVERPLMRWRRATRPRRNAAEPQLQPQAA